MAEIVRAGAKDGAGEQEFTFRNVQLFKNETLGTGSYGAVCKAKCDQLICAAKLLYPVLFQIQAPDPGKEHRQPFRRFERECRFLSRVNHPNIVQYLGTYRDPETNAPVLLMELMDESLTHFLESSSGDIPYHIQVNLSQDIAQALAFLHANGIIHRDLSSNNVLLIAGSRAKVTDFGMSRFEDINKTRLATMTTCPGTPVFMSPEALDEPPVYPEKLDNFSLGVLFVQILCQKFPEPGNRFETVLIPSPRNPKRMTEAKVAIPEVERRQAHISLIEPTHHLLPIALECLKDEAVERPSSQQLCQSLDALKKTARYEESSKHGDQQILHALLQEKDRQLQAKDENIQSLQNEVVDKEQQLMRLNQQLEESTTSHQQAITQKDREISELKQKLLATNSERPSTEKTPIAQAAPVPNECISMKWETLPDAPGHFTGVSAVVSDKAYFRVSPYVWEFNSTNNQWHSLPDHPLNGFTLVGKKYELLTVGGVSYNWPMNKVPSNKLYSYIRGDWVESHPHMPTKRWGCAAVYTDDAALIVAGGLGDGASKLSTVEVLNTVNNQWSVVSPLPFSVAEPSVAICGEYIYLCEGYSQSEQAHSVLRYSVLALLLTYSPKWETIASLPVKGSSLVTVKDNLLAVGGKTFKGEDTRDIYQYDHSWQVVDQMRFPHSQCVTAVLPNNKLMVVGGNSCELATFS